MDAKTAETAHKTTPVPNPGLFIAVLAFLGGLTPLSIDMYLPAMPSLARELHTTPGAVQQTLSAFMLGYAAGMLFWGAIGDRFGRRRPMLIGLAVYVAASILCASMANIDAIIGMRLLQALGGCAVATLAQASVADVYDRQQSAKAFSLIMAVSLMAPMVAPLLGGLLLTVFGWRVIFWVLAGFGVLSMIGVGLIPETLPPERRQRVPAGELLKGYLEVLSHRRFLAYAFAGGLMFAAMFTYIAATPFIYIEVFKVPPQAFGLLFGLNVIGMMGMNILNSRLIGRFGPDRLMRFGLMLAAGMALVLLVTGHAGLRGAVGLVSIAVPVFVVVSCLGLVGGNAAAGALSEFRDRAGVASAIMGAINTALGAVTAAVVGALMSHDATPGPMSVVIFGATAVALGVSLLGLRRART